MKLKPYRRVSRDRRNDLPKARAFRAVARDAEAEREIAQARKYQTLAVIREAVA